MQWSLLCRFKLMMHFLWPALSLTSSWGGKNTFISYVPNYMLLCEILGHVGLLD